MRKQDGPYDRQVRQRAEIDIGHAGRLYTDVPLTQKGRQPKPEDDQCKQDSHAFQYGVLIRFALVRGVKTCVSSADARYVRCGQGACASLK